MLSSKTYKNIKDGIEKGHYKSVRLVGFDEKGERQILVTYNKANSKPEALGRLDYIRHQIEKVLKTGKYAIECKAGHASTPLDPKFPFEIKTPITIPLNAESSQTGIAENEVHDKTYSQETMHREIDLDEYKDLLEEKSELKTEIGLLKMKIQLLESQLQNPPAPLNDAPASSGIAQMLNDHLPTAMSILDKVLNQRDKQLELKEREIDLKESGTRRVKKSKRPSKDSKEEILLYMRQLEQDDEEAFENTLDELEKKDPEIYTYVCKEMEIEFEEEEEEEEEQE